VVVNRDIYLFGGKSRIFQKNLDGSTEYIFHSDHVFGDFWKLSVEKSTVYQVSYKNISVQGTRLESAGVNESIPQDSIYYAKLSADVNYSIAASSDPVSPRNSLCIEKLKVRVSLIVEIVFIFS
jgi:hypothetical protein